MIRIARLSLSLRIISGMMAWLLPALLSAGEFLVISDIHFDPFSGLDAKQFEQLKDLSHEDWPRFFRELEQPIGRLGVDSNYALLESALDAAKARLPETPFILYPGDFLAHDWQKKYDALSAKTIEQDPQAYREFSRKAISLVAHEFQHRFPETPIFATLGNEDSYCQDYWIEPNDAFFSMFAETWEPLLRESVSSKEFQSSFESLGAYTAELPGLKKSRLIVLNAVFWSSSYATDYFKPAAIGGCGYKNPGPIPGRDQMKWLESQLDLAKRDGRRVWLLMHIPPGLDSYAEVKATGTSRTATMWMDEFTSSYRDLIASYQDVVQISFTGHVHMDDFRMDRVKGSPVLLHKIVPAVSPVFGNNPAFQVFQIDDETQEIVNWQTYFADLSSPAPSQKAATWGLAYDAKAIYGIEIVTAATISQLFEGMKADPEGSRARAYASHYNVGATSIAQQDLMIYLCAVLHETFESYQQALMQHGLAPPKRDSEAAQLRRAAGGVQ